MARVEVEPIQGAVNNYLAKGGSWSEVCRNLGFERNGKPDSSRLRVMLGMKPNGSGKKAKHMNAENASNIIRAIGADPVDFGV